MTLKIQKSMEDELVVFTLAGRIRAQQIPELLALLRSESSTPAIVLDLEEVKLVDRDAVLFLALSEARGARLRNCAGYIREWINQERNARRNGANGPGRSEG